MITENLFKKVLIEPVEQGANKLYVISGFASSAMAFHHLNTLREKNKSVEIKLIVGMCPRSGISITNHRGFQNLMEKEFEGKFECSYLTKEPAVHSKAYVWYYNEQPLDGFVGSANYSQNAFGEKQRELLYHCKPEILLSYFKSFIGDSIYCNHPESESYVRLYNEKNYERIIPSLETTPVLDIPKQAKLLQVKVPLVSTDGSVQKTAGLNWGFRQTGAYKRNKNEAYIQLRPEVYKSDFFPTKSIHFTVLTDDNKVLTCTRAQKDERGQAIETPHDNSRLGEYFRYRLSLPNGAFVEREDLDRYGRFDVDFYKLEDETYYMDFSV